MVTKPSTISGSGSRCVVSSFWRTKPVGSLRSVGDAFAVVVAAAAAMLCTGGG